VAPHLTPRRRIALALAAALTGSAALAVNAYATADKSEGDGTAKAKAAAPSGLNGPYLYLGWGNPPKAADLLKETGLTQLTMAFILSDGGCSPAWDGSRPLEGGQDAETIKAVQDAGGDVTPSIGGWSGSKLGEVCSSAEELAGAYQKVIDAYKLKSIDVDIEANEFEMPNVRQKVVDALKIVKEKNKDIKVYLTFPTLEQAPTDNGKDLIKKGAAAGLDVDGWTVMPFDFGHGDQDMAKATQTAVDGLAKIVADEYKIDQEKAYGKVGFSSMNGKTDQPNESISPSDFQKMVDYATEHHLARVSFWSANRDRPCSSGDGNDSCSGIDQKEWEFSKIVAGYQG
jgi:chitinase